MVSHAIVHADRAPHISRGAALFYSALRKQRTAFIKQATSHLKLLYESDQTEVAGILSRMPSIKLKPTIDKLRTMAGRSGANQAASMIGINPFQSVPQRVKDYVAENSLEQIGKDLDETTVNEIRTILEDGLENETAFSKIVTEIKQAGAFSRDRAERIAVSEIGNAFSQGTLGVGKDLSADGLDMEKSWLAEADACPICEDNANDEWIDIDEDFSSGDDAPLAHPNCLCALLVRRVGSEE